MKSLLRKSALAVALAAMSASAYSADTFEGKTKDAWLTGKVETVFLLNRHLNGFKIDTDVENGIVVLTGTVESDIERDLAETLAEGVDGVVDVRNMLEVDSATARKEPAARGSDGGRSFGAWADDATTTAAVKSMLVKNRNVSGLEIDVDTRGDIVTLSGRVESSEEKTLAEEIARNTGDVRDVQNNLVVDPE